MVVVITWPTRSSRIPRWARCEPSNLARAALLPPMPLARRYGITLFTVSHACLAVVGSEMSSQVRTNAPTAPLVMPLVTTSPGSPGSGSLSLNTANTIEVTSARPMTAGALFAASERPQPYNAKPNASRPSIGAP